MTRPRLRNPRFAPCAPLLLLGLLAGGGTLVTGCVPAPGGPAAAPAGYARALKPDEADLWRGQNYQGLLLDVREPAGWTEAPALLAGGTEIPLGELELRLDEIASFRAKPVLVFAQDGPRGNAAAQLLVRNGFRDVSYLDGGLAAYRAARETR